MVLPGAYLPARRCQRVAFSIFLCFFLRMRLRRFLISDPMSVNQASGGCREPVKFLVYRTYVPYTRDMDDQREQARQLRRQGLSRSQIRAKLGLRSDKMLSRWLQGVPASEWTKRPRAKDELRAEALRLRIEERLTYDEILERVPVSKSSLSL